MKKTILTIVLSLVVGLGAGWMIFRSGDDSGGSGGRKVLFYRDPMNAQNTSPVMKKAPDGMDFVPVYADESTGSGERKIAYYQDPMHPWYTSDKPGKAPDCGMDLVPVYEGESDAKGIKIDPVTIQNIGVKVEEATMRKLTRVIRTVGQVKADETKIYSINSKIMGWVEKLNVDYTGMQVRKGEPLLELYSPELVTTQEEYLQAIRYREKLGKSSMEEARDGAGSLVASAKRRLLNWDIPESEIAALERRGTPTKTMTFYSPVNGYVMEKMVLKGQSVMAGMELYKIADLSTVWIIADIYQYELPWVKVGQRAEIELSYMPGKKFQGEVTYVYPTLNMETKTAKVRIAVRNTPALEFKPEMFTTVKIASPVAVNAVAVPEQAIIRSGERNVVVIALGGGYFDPRDVKLGVTADGYVQILDGVQSGEKIVVSSQFLIDSESNLKAAISQMSGQDTSKAGAAPPAGEHGELNDDRGDTHAGHEMKAPAKEENHSGHTMKSTDDPATKNAGDPYAHPHADQVSMIDPVCGMETTGDEKLSAMHKGKKYFFCSEFDLKKFQSNPDEYTD